MPRTGLSAEAVRERAVAIAKKKIRSLGFDRVRLADIARELGVSHVALYKHFPDKAALLDAVSEEWLDELDARLETIVEGEEPALERIEAWMLALHRAKRERVRRDPELYRGFDKAADSDKPFVARHVATTDRHLVTLVEAAVRERAMMVSDPAEPARVLREATLGFHHPKLVAERAQEEREDDLRRVLAALFRAFR